MNKIENKKIIKKNKKKINEEKFNLKKMINYAFNVKMPIFNKKFEKKLMSLTRMCLSTGR